MTRFLAAAEQFIALFCKWGVIACLLITAVAERLVPVPSVSGRRNPRTALRLAHLPRGFSCGARVRSIYSAVGLWRAALGRTPLHDGGPLLG